MELKLFSRKGCCICKGLEDRLKLLALNKLDPSLDLTVIDIDSPQASREESIKYNLEVPVLILVLRDQDELREVELPRVSPRLNSDALAIWLQKNLAEIVNS